MTAETQTKSTDQTNQRTDAIAAALREKCSTFYGVRERSDKMHIFGSGSVLSALNCYYNEVMSWIHIDEHDQDLLVCVESHDYQKSKHAFRADATADEIVETIWPAFVAAVHRHWKHMYMVSSFKCPHCANFGKPDPSSVTIEGEDTREGQAIDHFLHIMEQEGFELVLQDEFVSWSRKELMFVLWHAKDGVLAQADTYNTSISSIELYFNWRAPEEDPDRPPLAGSSQWSNGVFYCYTKPEKGVRLTLTRQRFWGSLVNHWQYKGFMKLVPYETYKTGNVDRESAERIARLPAEIRRRCLLD